MIKLKVNPFRRLTIKDLTLYYACSRCTAMKRKQEIIKYFNEKRPCKQDYINMSDLCEYDGCNLYDLHAFLTP